MKKNRCDVAAKVLNGGRRSSW